MMFRKDSVGFQVMLLLVFRIEIYLASLGYKLGIVASVLVSIWGSNLLFSFHYSKDL